MLNKSVTAYITYSLKYVENSSGISDELMSILKDALDMVDIEIPQKEEILFSTSYAELLRNSDNKPTYVQFIKDRKAAVEKYASELNTILMQSIEEGEKEMTPSLRLILDNPSSIERISFNSGMVLFIEMKSGEKLTFFADDFNKDPKLVLDLFYAK